MKKATRPVTIDGIEFDALLSSSEEYTNDIPQYTVEDGIDVSDTIISKPETLEMILVLSDTPVTWKSIHNTQRIDSEIQRLKELFFSRTLVTVSTFDMTYTNMAISTIKIEKPEKNGTSREIPISFQKVYIASAQTTTMPDSYGKSGTTKSPSGTASTSSAKTKTNSNGKVEVNPALDALKRPWMKSSDVAAFCQNSAKMINNDSKPTSVLKAVSSKK